jgi:large subunit ribosomal protein L18
LATITSKDLLKNGWDEKKAGSLKSVPAGYLTGMLMAKKLTTRNSVPSSKGTKVLSSSGKGKYIVDLGLARTLKGGRVFSVVKGLIDGGLDVPANEKVFPSEERLNGEHLKDDVKAMIAKVKEGLK